MLGVVLFLDRAISVCLKNTMKYTTIELLGGGGRDRGSTLLPLRQLTRVRGGAGLPQRGRGSSFQLRFREAHPNPRELM